MVDRVRIAAEALDLIEAAANGQVDQWLERRFDEDLTWQRVQDLYALVRQLAYLGGEFLRLHPDADKLRVGFRLEAIQRHLDADDLSATEAIGLDGDDQSSGV